MIDTPTPYVEYNELYGVYMVVYGEEAVLLGTNVYEEAVELMDEVVDDLFC